jgi:hypothetical protein
MRKMRKIGFLDLDGVANCEHTPRPFSTDMYGSVTFHRDEPPIDEWCLRNLNELAGRNPDIDWVLSTSWRLAMPNLAGFLERAGFIGNIVGQTPEDRPGLGYFRGQEIVDWLEGNQPNWEKTAKVFILDDNPTDDTSPTGFHFTFKPLEHLLVQTSWSSGFTMAEIPKVEALLA